MDPRRLFLVSHVVLLSGLECDLVAQELEGFVRARNNELPKQVSKHLKDLVRLQVALCRLCVVEFLHFIHLKTRFSLFSKIIT